MDTEKINEILKANPNVDPQKLATALDALRQLREAGVARMPGYTIEAPYSRPLRKVSETNVLLRILRRGK